MAAVVLIVLVVTIVLTTGKDYDAFAACLADEGFVMAGTEWCSFCQEQKSKFKGSFEDVIIPAGAYKDCDREMQWCQEKGIASYPMWVTPDDNLISGVQSLPMLARISGCKL